MQYYRIAYFSDNYTWLLVNSNGQAIAIDCGESTALAVFLKENNLILTHVLVTHYHADHTAGLDQIKQNTGCRILAGELTKNMLDSKVAIDEVVKSDQIININGFNFRVMEAASHTLDHIMFFEYSLQWLFCGDVLFSLGCGRLFEGEAEDLAKVIKAITNLPKETLLFPAHEYTKSNLQFVDSLKYFTEIPLMVKKASKIKEQEVTLPVKLSEELVLNPFLNHTNPLFKQFMGLGRLSDVEFLGHLRKLKDDF